MSEKNKWDLSKMNLPYDLKKLTLEECEELCGDIRSMLIDTVSKNGGHLASNLGTVELTMAIHRVFESPKDKIVWDVGHQAYTHKILTGRAKQFSTLRQNGGISGFCRPDESVHDAFISGHSSTSISAALGIATAMKLNGDRQHHAVAVVGDGASTGGMTYEGLNNAGKSDTNIIVILNYNEMSISKNVGGMAKYLSQMRTKETYQKTKSIVERTLDNTPVVGKGIKKAIRNSKNAFKEIILHSTMFEDLGFEYIGPVNGHSLEDLEEALKAAKSMNKPVFVHVNTVKGKGYAPAEQNPGEYHGVGSFEVATGNPDVVLSDSFSSVIGKELCYLGGKFDKICAVTAAMKYGTGLQYFAKKFPNRFFDVGIAEEHAVTFCGGLASMGMIPVFAVYSTFLQRSYDQIIHDLAICKTHAVICVDRAGIVGDDGETHQGIFDVSFLTSVPDIKIYSPSNYKEAKLCLNEAVLHDKGTVAVRYPRGNDKSVYDKSAANINYSYSKSDSRILIVTYGRLYNNVYSAVEILRNKDIKCDMLKLVNIFPISNEVAQIIDNYDRVFFFEEAYFSGGIGEKYASICNNVETHGIYDFVEHGKCDVLLDKLGLSAQKIAGRIEDYVKNEQT